jgi:hypothetical protein
MANVRAEGSGTSLYGDRTINALVIAESFPHIFARAVVSSSMPDLRLRVETIYGVELRSFLASSQKSLKEKVAILLQIANQFNVMIDHGVQIFDRNTTNIMIDFDDNAWQVDLEYVVNVLTGKTFTHTEDLDMGTAARKKKVSQFYKRRPLAKVALSGYYASYLNLYLFCIPEIGEIDSRAQKSLGLPQTVQETLDFEADFTTLKNILIKISKLPRFYLGGT